MPLQSQGHYVFTVLTDLFCLYNYEFWLSLCKIVRSSVILLLSLFNRYFVLSFALVGVHVAHLFSFLCLPICVFLVTSTTNVIVFRLTRPELEHKSYCTGCVHAIIRVYWRLIQLHLQVNGLFHASCSLL